MRRLGLAFVLALALAGCGGDDRHGGLTRAEAERIAKDPDREFDKRLPYLAGDMLEDLRRGEEPGTGREAWVATYPDVRVAALTYCVWFRRGGNARQVLDSTGKRLTVWERHDCANGRF